MIETRVESKKNETIRRIRSLQEKKYRRALDAFFIEGVTLFFESLDAGLVPETVVLSRSADEALFVRVRGALADLDCRLIVVPEEVYAAVSTELAPQGVLAVFCLSAVLETSAFRAPQSERYLFLEEVRDPANVGAILRSAAAFGYRGAIFVDCADLFNPKTVRACMGALFCLELLVCDTLEDGVDTVKTRGLSLYGTSPRAKKDIRDADWSRPFALVIGNEGHGMTEEARECCDELLGIPMQGMESLNAACAAAVTLYESTRGAE